MRVCKTCKMIGVNDIEFRGHKVKGIRCVICGKLDIEQVSTIVKLKRGEHHNILKRGIEAIVHGIMDEIAKETIEEEEARVFDQVMEEELERHRRRKHETHGND